MIQMKKILIALAIMGIACSGAEAQNRAPVSCTCKAKKIAAKKVVHRNNLRTASFVKNYQVCRENGGYYTCCLYKKTTTAALR
jgi:hypothetical protein